METRKKDRKARRRERLLYLVLIVLLVLYGLTNSEGAATLIRAVTEAFAILLTNNP